MSASLLGEEGKVKGLWMLIPSRLQSGSGKQDFNSVYWPELKSSVQRALQGRLGNVISSEARSQAFSY